MLTLYTSIKILPERCRIDNDSLDEIVLQHTQHHNSFSMDQVRKGHFPDSIR